MIWSIANRQAIIPKFPYFLRQISLLLPEHSVSRSRNSVLVRSCTFSTLSRSIVDTVVRLGSLIVPQGGRVLMTHSHYVRAHDGE